MTHAEIDNFRCTYHVPKGERNPHTLKKRLDLIVAETLPEKLDGFFSFLFRDDASLVFIKNIKIDFSIKIAQLDEKEIAEFWAKRIASSVKKTLAGSDPKNNWIRFADESDYLASFMVDLLSGVAWQKWYYRELEDLKKFDRRGLIKELLTQKKEIAEDILFKITERNFSEELIKELREEDAEIIYKDCIDGRKKRSGKGLKKLFDILMESLERSSFVLQGEKPDSFKNYLSLYLHSIQSYPELRSVANVKNAVELVFLLREFLSKHRRKKALSEAIQKGDQEGLLSFVRSNCTGELSRLSGLVDKVTVSEGKRVFFDVFKGFKEKLERTSRDTILTQYGGLFILIRAILETKLHLLVECSSFPDGNNLPRKNAFLLFLAQWITSHKKLLYEGIDPGLLLFAGYRNNPIPGLLKGFAHAITPEMNRRFLESLSSVFTEELSAIKADMRIKQNELDFCTVLDITKRLIFQIFSRKLTRFERSSPEYLFKNFIQRRSELILSQESVRVKLSRRPLDVVLRMSGFLENIDEVPWLGNRSIQFVSSF